MRGAVLHGAHDFRMEDLDTPILKENECLVNIKACGVCHSEIHQWDRKIDGLEYPRHIGHEVSGVIENIGSNITRFKKGDRVAAWVDGKGYAEQVAVQEDRLFPMSDSLEFRHAILEPVACTTNGVMRANIQLGDTVALVGTGFMGLILLQQIKHVGASKIIAIDIRDEMLSVAGKLGADVLLNPLRDNIEAVIKDLTNGRGVDVSFEIGGLQTTLDSAADITRMEGKLVIFGYHPGERIIKDLGYWNWMAFDIINAHFRNLDTILKGSRIGMEMINAGKINMEVLITHTMPLEEINKAFEISKNKPEGFIKSVVINE
ncbi:MAG: zinc-binding dehydrogenase [Melioribacteraceae bacterium]|nr:zinc-binding dehydrogenase [Melioribacteraceae bacterium]